MNNGWVVSFKHSIVYEALPIGTASTYFNSTYILCLSPVKILAVFSDYILYVDTIFVDKIGIL